MDGITTIEDAVTDFEILWQPRTWYPWLRPFTHVESSIENIRRDMVARRSLTGAARSQVNTPLSEGASA